MPSQKRREKTKKQSKRVQKKAAKLSRDHVTSQKAAKAECFVIMPYGDWFDDYFDIIYKPAIADAGLEATRADDLYRPSTIVNDIWTYTKSAKIVLADLTGKNPNVFYELGLAHAAAKPAILITQGMDDVPFDLRALRIIVYDKNNPNWGAELRETIITAIGEVLENPLESVPSTFIQVDAAKEKEKVTPQQKELVSLRQEVELLSQRVRQEADRKAWGATAFSNPKEAEVMIENYLRRGLPTHEIIMRMVRRGAPRAWVEATIENWRARRVPVEAVNPPSPSSGTQKMLSPPTQSSDVSQESRT